VYPNRSCNGITASTVIRYVRVWGVLPEMEQSGLTKETILRLLRAHHLLSSHRSYRSRRRFAGARPVFLEARQVACLQEAA